MPASVWPKSCSIERISAGTRSPVQPTSISAAQPSAAAIPGRERGPEGMTEMLAGGPGVYRRSMARSAASAPVKLAASAKPSGVLFFIHGANETSEGLVENVARIEDQVRARGWDVTVVAPNGAASPACGSGTGRRRSTGAAGPRRCRSRSCAAGSARTRS